MITALRKTKVLKKSDSNYGYLGHIGIPCIVKNWDENTEFFFGNCLETENLRQENYLIKLKQRKVNKQ